jgi:hypothetical protein
VETFKDILERFKPDEMRFKEIVKFYQPLQASASEIRSEIDRLEKVVRGSPVHSLFIDRYRALAEEVNRQKELADRTKDEERLRRRVEGIWEEDPDAEVEVGKEVTVEVEGDLNEEVLADLNSHFWMNFEFVGEEVPGFGFYWAEKEGGGTIMGNAQIDGNSEAFGAIIKACMGISSSFPELKLFIESKGVEGTVFGTEIMLQGGEWVIYKDKIAEFLTSLGL